MNKFIELIQSFIDQKIDFKIFHDEWQKLYLDSGIYEPLSDSEKDFLDEVHSKEDYALSDEKELKDLRKNSFVSVDEFRQWLNDFKEKRSS